MLGDTDAAKTIGAVAAKRASEIDQHVGSRLRRRRNMLGISQDRLAQGVGLSFQQIQKYENGSNRIGASRLYQLSRLLDVDVNYFFDELDDDGQLSAIVSKEMAIDHLLDDDQGILLVRAFATISDTRQRASLVAFARSLASENQESS